MVKRYFTVNTKEFRLPEEFIHARGRKHIHFIHCRLEYQNQLVGNASVHADWVTEMPCLDSFISWANVDITKRFKWALLHNPKQVRIWFKENATNDIVVPDGSFVLQLMLEWE